MAFYFFQFFFLRFVNTVENLFQNDGFFDPSESDFEIDIEPLRRFRSDSTPKTEDLNHRVGDLNKRLAHLQKRTGKYIKIDF